MAALDALAKTIRWSDFEQRMHQLFVSVLGFTADAVDLSPRVGQQSTISCGAACQGVATSPDLLPKPGPATRWVGEGLEPRATLPGGGVEQPERLVSAGHLDGVRGAPAPPVPTRVCRPAWPVGGARRGWNGRCAPARPAVTGSVHGAHGFPGWPALASVCAVGAMGTSVAPCSDATGFHGAQPAADRLPMSGRRLALAGRTHHDHPLPQVPV